MSKWFDLVLLALALMFAISAIKPAAAGPSQATSRQQATSQQATSETTDISSRRRHRAQLHREAAGPYDRPAHYDRPQYYRTYPYNLPPPSVFRIGFRPWR